MYWNLRNVCREAIQRYWFGRCEIKDVLSIYGIENDEPCHDHVVKVLIKSKKDFQHGYSFFTRETIDEKVVALMRRFHARCMGDAK